MTELNTSEEQQLRKALGMIGAEAGRDENPPSPARHAVWWRSRAALAGTLVTAAALCAGLLTYSSWRNGPEQPGGNSASQGQTLTEAIACSTMVLEGDVVAVRDASKPGRVTLTFAVQEWIKPAHGDGKVNLDLADPAVVDPAYAFKPGTHLLLLVPQRKTQTPGTFQGDKVKKLHKRIEQLLPEAAKTQCPPAFQENSTISPTPIPGDA